MLSISVFLASIDAQEWEDCVDSHRDDEEQSFVDTCYSHTQALKECMDRNPEYYQTINVRFLNLTSFRMYSMYLESVDPCALAGGGFRRGSSAGERRQDW